MSLSSLCLGSTGTFSIFQRCGILIQGDTVIRLFIAVEIPDTTKKHLARLQKDVPAARWVKPEQLHLTLSFLGEQEDATTNQLITELKSIQSGCFDLYFDSTGCFPNQRHPRVLWVGLKPEPLLINLVHKISSTVTSCGIQQEERPFSPHITLARIKQPIGVDIRTFLEHHPGKIPGFPVQEFILFQSRLTEKGAEHIPFRKFDLQRNR